jgi:hypothetical protein
MRDIPFIKQNSYTMRNLFFALSVLFLVFSACEKSSDSPNTDSGPDTVKLAMGANYTNDIYYKLDSGIVATVPRNNWDIAFHISSMSSTILTNGGNNIVLYAYPGGDTTAWRTVDVTNIGSWKALYNSDTTWTMGAFERNSKMHPDYGWGVYNSTSHDVVGDSLFVIKLSGGQLKKIWIHRKYSSQNMYKISYANIDGTDSVTKIIDCKPYTSKNFVYYSLSTNSVIDREPAKEKWDFVLTKYVEMVPTALVHTIPNIVTGILTNTMRLSTMGTISYSGVMTSQFDGASQTTVDYNQAPFKTSISLIGSDWKTFDMATNTYTVKNDVVYFIKNRASDIYRLVFLTFEGGSTGALSFEEFKVN